MPRKIRFAHRGVHAKDRVAPWRRHAEKLRVNFSLRGSRAWIRTMIQRSKVSCPAFRRPGSDADTTELFVFEQEKDRHDGRPERLILLGRSKGLPRDLFEL